MMKRQLSLLESFSKKPKSSKLNLEPEESPDSESLKIDLLSSMTSPQSYWKMMMVMSYKIH